MISSAFFFMATSTTVYIWMRFVILKAPTTAYFPSEAWRSIFFAFTMVIFPLNVVYLYELMIKKEISPIFQDKRYWSEGLKGQRKIPLLIKVHDIWSADDTDIFYLLCFGYKCIGYVHLF